MMEDNFELNDLVAFFRMQDNVRKNANSAFVPVIMDKRKLHKTIAFLSELYSIKKTLEFHRISDTFISNLANSCRKEEE